MRNIEFMSSVFRLVDKNGLIHDMIESSEYMSDYYYTLLFNII